jgi:hypothetical protein
MKQISIFFAIVAALLFLGGCSSRQVYKPTQKVVGDWPYQHDLTSSIAQVNGSAAVLENGNIIHGDTVLDTKVDYAKQTVLNVQKDWIISADINGTVLLKNRKDAAKNITFNLGKTVAAASVHDNTLAVLFASDNLALYSLSDKTILFQAQGNAPYAVDTRVVNPYFLNNLVIFPTLDGRLVIVNATNNTVVKSIILSSKDYFNNIIGFDVKGNNLIAVTGYGIVSLENGEKRASYEVRDMRFTANGIYLATKDGTVYLLTPTLQVKAKKKFPFAHFLGMIATDKRVYLLLRQGYIVSLRPDLSKYKIYDADVDEDSYVYVGDKAFYVDGNTFSIQK